MQGEHGPPNKRRTPKGTDPDGNDPETIRARVSPQRVTPQSISQEELDTMKDMTKTPASKHVVRSGWYMKNGRTYASRILVFLLAFALLLMPFAGLAEEATAADVPEVVETETPEEKGVSADALTGRINTKADGDYLEFSPTSVTINQGASAQVAVIARNSAKEVLSGSVTSASSSSDNVSVAFSGSGSTVTVTGVAGGTATITVTFTGGITGTFTVTVVANPTSITVAGADSVTLNTAYPYQALIAAGENNTVTWTSEPSDGVTIVPNGIYADVTFKKPGSYKIIATGVGSVKGELTVTATGASAVTGIALKNASLQAGLATADSATIEIVPTPSNAYVDLDNATFTSSNTAVATVGAKTGVVTAVAAGYTTITLTYQGLTATATVTVYPKPTSIYVVPATVKRGTATAITATVYPAANGTTAPAADQSVTWKIYKDAALSTEIKDSTASITTAGVLTVTDDYTSDTLYVQATSAAKESTTISNSAKITVEYAGGNITSIYWLKSSIDVCGSTTLKVGTDYGILPANANPYVLGYSDNANLSVTGNANGTVTLTIVDPSKVSSAGEVANVRLFSPSNNSITTPTTLAVKMYKAPTGFDPISVYSDTTATNVQLSPTVIPAEAKQEFKWNTPTLEATAVTAGYAISNTGVLTIPANAPAGTVAISGLTVTNGGTTPYSITVTVRPAANKPLSLYLGTNTANHTLANAETYSGYAWMSPIAGAALNTFAVSDTAYVLSGMAYTELAPANASAASLISRANIDFTYSSSNTDVATIEKVTSGPNGIGAAQLMAKKEGVTNITVKVVGTSLSYTVPISVVYATPAKVQVDIGGTYYPTSSTTAPMSINLDETTKFPYRVLDADDKTSTVKQSVTVTVVPSTAADVVYGDGYFTLKGKTVTTSAHVYVMTSNGIFSVYSLTVKPGTITSWAIDQGDTIGLTYGGVGALTTSFTPAASAQAITWSTSNSNVVSVTSTGAIIGAGVGSATVTATLTGSSPADSKSITVIVYDANAVTAPTSLSIETNAPVVSGKYQMVAGTTATATAVVNSGAYGNVNWTTSDAKVLGFGANGAATHFGTSATLNAKSEGTATVTATAIKGGMTANIEITVTYANAQSITLLPSAPVVDIGGSVQLFATVLPTSASQVVKWASLNTAIATVDADTGIVTGVSAGKVQITATTTKGTYLSKNVEVEVKALKVTKVEIIDFPELASAGDVIDLKAVVYPAEANQTIDWTFTPATGNFYVSNGKIYTQGPVTITATATATGAIDTSVTGASNTASKTVVVKHAVESISVSPATITGVYKGDIKTLTKSIYPTTAHDKVTWTSDNPKVALVSDDGVVTIMGGGEATITATAVGGKTATSKITASFRELTGGIAFNPAAVSVKRFETLQLNLTTNPDGADPSATYASSDESIVTVNEDGVVYGVKEGTATITATSKVDSKFTAQATVTVTASTTTITPVVPELTVKVGQYYDLTATVSPASAGMLKWSSDNTSIVRVGANAGRLQGVAPGTANISIYLVNNANVKVVVPVTVASIPTGVRIFANAADVEKAEKANSIDGTKVAVGKSVDVYARVLPLDVVDGRYQLATVDASGNAITVTGITFKQSDAKITITGKAAGTYYVKVMSRADNTKFKTIKITVN